MSNRFGLRRTLVVGLSGFTATALVSVFVTNATMLIVVIGLTGVFAATIIPISLAVMVKTFPKDKVPGAITVWAAVSGLAIALGPLIGGALLTSGYRWGSVFLVVALLGLSVLVLTVLVVHTPAAAGGSCIRPIPVVGSVSGIGPLVWRGTFTVDKATNGRPPAR
ncbi:MAG: MFS transporter [Micrococcaceae bacterium]|nr:MFS transporter [Micrococcaceae bacterium]